MPHKIIWSAKARFDLREIIEFIARDQPGAARRFGKALVKTVESLALHPQLGRLLPERPEIYREIVQRPYRIIYRAESGARAITVVRIWHGARGEPQL